MKYKALVNNHFEFKLSDDAINGLDIVSEAPGTFHIVQDGQSFKATVLAHDFSKKTFSLKINGRVYDLKLDDQYDQLVSKLGLEISTSNKIKDVKAPMPGLVLDIAVNPGQVIKEGDKLLILEAMKMENVIKSAGEGVVKTIHIDKGNAVDKGQLLIEME